MYTFNDTLLTLLLFVLNDHTQDASCCWSLPAEMENYTICNTEKNTLSINDLLMWNMDLLLWLYSTQIITE